MPTFVLIYKNRLFEVYGGHQKQEKIKYEIECQEMAWAKVKYFGCRNHLKTNFGQSHEFKCTLGISEFYKCRSCKSKISATETRFSLLNLNHVIKITKKSLEFVQTSVLEKIEKIQNKQRQKRLYLDINADLESKSK